MNRRTVSLNLVVVFALLLGCASQEKRLTLSVANRTFGSTMTILTELRRDGHLSPDQIKLINEWYPKAEAALDRWEMLIRSGKDEALAVDDFQTATQVLESIVFDAQIKKENK